MSGIFYKSLGRGWLSSSPLFFCLFICVSDILFVTSHRLKKYGYGRDKKIPSRNANVL